MSAIDESKHESPINGYQCTLKVMNESILRIITNSCEY